MTDQDSKTQHLAKSFIFLEYKKKIDGDLKKVLHKITKQAKTRKNYQENPLEKIEKSIRILIQKKLGETIPDSTIKLTAPPQEINADYTITTFLIAKFLGIKPEQVAQKIVEIIKENTKTIKEIKNVECSGPYVNIFVNPDSLYQSFLNYVLYYKRDFGKNYSNLGRIAIIDFSSPNIAKPLGFSHLRSTVIGHALANLYEFTGYTVVRDNHLGDWGTQFGELIYAYKKWGNDKIINKNPIGELKKLYVKFHEESEKNPQAKEDARLIFSELENGDEQLLRLWKKFRDWSIEDFKKTYKKIGIKFDTYIGESYFNDQIDNVINDCLEKKVCVQDNNSALIVVGNLDQLPSFLLRKQDGSSLYITRDLATLKHRINLFKPSNLLYVVGEEQKLNFRQLFALAREIGYLPENVKAEHVSFGMVLKEGKKMSTRKGTTIELEEVLKQAEERAFEILIRNNPNLNNQELKKIASIIGIGAILYNDLKQSRAINISFDLDKMLKLEIGGAPYLQYTCVRINSIIEKLIMGQEKLKRPTKYVFNDLAEFELAKKIQFFSEVVTKAQQLNSPHLVCTYLDELAQQFNNLYSRIPILKTQSRNLLYSRIALIDTIVITLENGLNLLGIQVPLRM